MDMKTKPVWKTQEGGTEHELASNYLDRKGYVSKYAIADGYHWQVVDGSDILSGSAVCAAAAMAMTDYYLMAPPSVFRAALALKITNRIDELLRDLRRIDPERAKYSSYEVGRRAGFAALRGQLLDLLK